MIPHHFIAQLPYVPHFRSLLVPTGACWPCAEFPAWSVSSGDLYDGNLRMTGTANFSSYSRLLGGGAIGMAKATPQRIVHAADQSPEGANDLLITIVLQGCGRFSQDGVDMVAGPGDVVFRHVRSTSLACIESTMQALIMRIPNHRFFGAYMGNHNRCEPRLIAKDVQTVAQAVSVALSALHRLATMPLSSLYFTEEAVIRLFAAAYFDGIPPSSTVSGGMNYRWERLISLIDAQACDPDLTINQCAEKLGISTRFVHKLFQQHGSRYGVYLLDRRLARACRELETSKLRHLKVSEIAYRSGFNDASHFSRTFRSHFGVSPSDYRDQFTPAQAAAISCYVGQDSTR